MDVTASRGSASAPGAHRRRGARGDPRRRIEIGYRHIDTAQSYGTRGDRRACSASAACRAASSSSRPRSPTPTSARDASCRAWRESLDRSASSRSTSLLIHWPSHRDAVPFEDYMTALAEAQARGQTRLIGVSNFTTTLLDSASRSSGRARSRPTRSSCTLPAEPELARLRRRQGMTVTAYMPLVRGRVLSEPALTAIAGRTGTRPRRRLRSPG